MELYQLKTFLAVAAEGHLTRAAERVFTSVPAVSAQIRALEEELGVQLFERRPRGMALTRVGELLREEAQDTLNAAQRLRRTAERLRGELQGQLRLGLVADPGTLRLGELLVELASKYPGLAPTLTQGFSGGNLEVLRRGELDGAFVLSDALELPGLSLQRLSNVELVVVLPPGQQAQDTAQLCELPWVSVPTHCGLRPPMDELFRHVGRLPPQGVMADSAASVRAMVASGLGASVLRSSDALEAQAAGELSIWPHWRSQTYLCWVQSSAALRDDPAQQALREVVVKLWGCDTASA